jgi:hypothetical protein
LIKDRGVPGPTTLGFQHSAQLFLLFLELGLCHRCNMLHLVAISRSRHRSFRPFFSLSNVGCHSFVGFPRLFAVCWSVFDGGWLPTPLIRKHSDLADSTRQQHVRHDGSFGGLHTPTTRAPRRQIWRIV